MDKFIYTNIFIFFFESLGIALIFPVVDVLVSENSLKNYHFLIQFFPQIENYKKDQIILLFLSFFIIFLN